MYKEQPIQKSEEEKKEIQRDIEHGLRLELIDKIPENTGKQFAAELKEALRSEDKEAVLRILKDIGDTIHARWGATNPTKPHFDEDQEKYQLGLSSQTGGTRLFVNMDENFSGDLIFPNVNMDHKIKGKTLADVFEELFGKLAENIQNEENPYYVVRLASAENKE